MRMTTHLKYSYTIILNLHYMYMNQKQKSLWHQFPSDSMIVLRLSNPHIGC